MNNYANYVATPKLGFGEAVKKVLNNLTNVKGRARRSEYWWFALAVVIVNLITSFVFGDMPLATTIVSIIISLMGVAVTVRRLQDTNKSAILEYINVICGIFIVIYMYASGYYDIAQSVNANPNELLGIFMSPVLLIPLTISFILSIVIFIFCLLDSNIGPNKYGDSPKYVLSDSAKDELKEEVNTL